MDTDYRIGWTTNGKPGEGVLTLALGDEACIDKLNITSERRRNQFLERAAERFPRLADAEPRGALRRELEKLAADEAGRLGADKSAPTDETDPAELLAMMPPETVDAAERMLDSPELLRLVADDIAAAGVAGERALAGIIYLVGTSRLLPKPLAAIVQGPSSSGKSYTVERVADLFPPESLIRATAMTPQALYYLRPGSLRHKWVVAGERSRAEDDDTAEATRALREMLASGRLVKLIPMKDAHGQMVTQRIEQDGPIAYVETTTLSRIFDEDANRCLLISTDEQRQQTQRILVRLAEGYGGTDRTDHVELVQRHHALQRLVRRERVVVPYAAAVAEKFHAERVEARRAFPQLMSMVTALALLHQRQRQRNEDGRLVAAPDDYRVARALLAKPLAKGLGVAISDPSRRCLDQLRTWVGSETFTAMDIKQRQKTSKGTAYGYASELADAGLIEVAEQGGRGRGPTKYRLGTADPDTAEVLPDDSILFSDSGPDSRTQPLTPS